MKTLMLTGAVILLLAGCGPKSESDKFGEFVYGCEYKAKRKTKEILKDPDSMETIEMKSVPNQKDNEVMVYIKYRAKNSFGGYAIGEALWMCSSGDYHNIKLIGSK